MSSNIESDRLKSLFIQAVPPPSLRWLNVGEVVTLKTLKTTFSNVEFQINQNPNWTIWFSQLNTILYNGDLDNLQVTAFKMKDGSIVFPCQLGNNPTAFVNLINGKKFRVDSVSQCFWPNKQHPKVRVMAIVDVYKEVHNALLNGKDYSVRGMLTSQNCYDFVEI